MRALVVRDPGPVENSSLCMVERSLPDPDRKEISIAVEACGVCRTDLHIVEGDLNRRREEIVPGHEVVGRVQAVGKDVVGRREGDRVGVAWLGATCGYCRFCRGGKENLCLSPSFTGWDVDGGYAESMIAKNDFVYSLPECSSAVDLAPLLCAGIIGYRAYEACDIRPGGRLGLFGFGGSAHIVIQLAKYRENRVFVVSRTQERQSLAKELGAIWVNKQAKMIPEKLDAAILFAPDGGLVRDALESLDRGGVLVIAGIYLSSIPLLNYEAHLYGEKTLRSVTANTRSDGRELLDLAVKIPIETATTDYPLEQASLALSDLKHDRIRGAAVLRMDSKS